MVRRDNAQSIGCRFCSFVGALKKGWRYNKGTRKQRYQCLCCGRRFVVDDGFIGVHHRPSIITKCLDLYNSGLGSWKTLQYIKRHHKRKVSRMSIFRWARKFGKKVYTFIRKFPLNFRGRNLHCDEKRPKVQKQQSYLWIMAFGTPHFIAETNLTADKDWSRPQNLFRNIYERTISFPPKIVTDGLGQYNSCKKYFLHNSKHVVYDSFKTWPNNNRLERLNGSIEDWLTRKGLHGLESARDLLIGWSVHQNSVHENSRNGITPAEGIGLRLNLKGDKWRRLITMAAL